METETNQTNGKTATSDSAAGWRNFNSDTIQNINICSVSKSKLKQTGWSYWLSTIHVFLKVAFNLFDPWQGKISGSHRPGNSAMDNLVCKNIVLDYQVGQREKGIGKEGFRLLITFNIVLCWIEWLHDSDRRRSGLESFCFCSILLKW